MVPLLQKYLSIHMTLLSCNSPSSTHMSAVVLRLASLMVTTLPAAGVRAYLGLLVWFCSFYSVTGGRAFQNGAYICMLHGSGPQWRPCICFPYLQNPGLVFMLTGPALKGALYPGEHLALFGFRLGCRPIAELIATSGDMDYQSALSKVHPKHITATHWG